MEAQLMALEGADPLPVRSASKKEGDSHVTPPLCDMLQSSQVWISKLLGFPNLTKASKDVLLDYNFCTEDPAIRQGTEIEQF